MARSEFFSTIKNISHYQLVKHFILTKQCELLLAIVVIVLVFLVSHNELGEIKLEMTNPRFTQLDN